MKRVKKNSTEEGNCVFSLVDGRYLTALKPILLTRPPGYFARPSTLKSYTLCYTPTSMHLAQSKLGWVEHNRQSLVTPREFPNGCVPIRHLSLKTSRRQFMTTSELCCANSVLSPGLVHLTSQISGGPGINSRRSEGNRRPIEKTSTSFSNASFDAHQKAFSKTPDNSLPTLKTDQTRHVGMVKTKMTRRGDWERFVRETHVPSTKRVGGGYWLCRGRICESRRP